MSDILANVARVNQPGNAYDNNSLRNNPGVVPSTQIQNVIDPSRVNRPDGKTETEDQRFAFNYESNFEKFIQTLKNSPGLTELFSKLMFMDAQTIITSGIGERFAEQIAAFMEMVKMDPRQLPGFLKSQAEGAGQFSGVFFQALRDVLSNTSSIELRTSILSFLKHYSDMASGAHLMGNIQEELKAIMPYIFKNDAAQLQEIVDRLIFRNPEEGALAGGGEQAGEMAEGGKNLVDLMDSVNRHNSQVLKEELLPFFSKYVSRTKDMGKARDIMTLITLNVSRYVNGSKEDVVQSFEKLLQFGDFSRKLGEIKGENLELILDRLLTERRDDEHNPWTERFIDMVRTGLSGEGGYENKLVFQNIMNAMLLNESVYMPLIHLMLPLNIGGNLMFSEMWVDPDSQNGHQSEGEEQSIRMLIKFDIKDLGYFDLVLNYQGGKVDMLVAYPPKLSAMEKQIRNGLGQIIADNGLNFQSLTLEQAKRPIPLTDVFPKIAERRNSINVRV